jgi:hypothetical protein
MLMTAAYTVDLKLKTMAKTLKRKYPTDDSDSRNRTRGTDEILTGTPKRRVDIVYKTQKDEDGYPTGYSTRTKTVTRFNRGPEGLESKVVRSKTKKVSDRRTSSTDPYAPSVQKKGGAIKKYQGEGEVIFPKKIDITAARDSTNVNMPGIKAFTPRDKEWLNYKKGPGQLRADEVFKKKQAFDAQQKLNKNKVGGSIKKYQSEGEVSKSRTVTKGPLGLTKTIVKTKTSPGKAPVTTTKTRRTVKGVLNDVGAKFRRPTPGGGAISVPGNYPDVKFPNFTPEERKKSNEEYLKRIREKQNQKKVGGSIKKKK